jgi:acyl-CoA reductase-like NAD-dependent aldehyde dehydrogenase
MATATMKPNNELLAETPVPFLVGGAWRAARSGEVIEVLDPADGTVLATVAAAGRTDIDEAVEAAWSAFPGWSSLPANDRAVFLHRLADVIEQRADEIASLESQDVGKPLREALGFDVPFAAQAFRYFADVSVHVRAREPIALPKVEAREVYLPRGPVGFIFPWNFPFLLFAWGTAPALAAGNTVVVKPADLTPLTSLLLGHLAEEAGIPAGVINVLPGLGEVAGAALSESHRIRMISFTGSPEVGKLVAGAAAANLVPSKLELGGKGAAVVFDDVDLSETAQALASAITLNAGQVCCTATRWMVHERIFDDFVARASDILARTSVGPGSDEGTSMGPVVSAGQRRRILTYLDRGVAEGASFLLEGGEKSVPGHEGGYYVAPALLTGPPDNVCAREEIFGPVAYVVPFRDEDDVVAMVNSSAYGLANSVWSSDLARANRVAERLVAGTTWVNAHNLFAYGLPYGGINLSGWGGGVNAPDTYFDYLRKLVVARPLTSN